MSELVDKLKHIQLAIFDLDGVVYRGESLISNADKVINELKEMSIKVVFNSNNSTATRETYVKRLKKYNINSKVTDFYTSASIASTEITKIKTAANIYVIGEIGLREELKILGHKIVAYPKDFDDIDFVIVGLDRDFNYDKLAIAQSCILEGNAKFYATNSDATLPVMNGFKPGAGTMVSALTTCVDKEPVRIFGKPEPFGIELILKDTNISPERACIFGDRLNTDILAGNRANLTTIAVLTGVTTMDMINEVKKVNNTDEDLIPNIVITNLSEIFKKLNA
jgi:4-nitrophenyl phosphatase